MTKYLILLAACVPQLSSAMTFEDAQAAFEAAAPMQREDAARIVNKKLNCIEYKNPARSYQSRLGVLTDDYVMALTLTPEGLKDGVSRTLYQPTRHGRMYGYEPPFAGLAGYLSRFLRVDTNQRLLMEGVNSRQNSELALSGQPFSIDQITICE